MLYYFHHFYQMGHMKTLQNYIFF